MAVYESHKGDFGDVFCDGKPLPDCLRVDTRKGTAIVLARDDAGFFRLRRGKMVVRPVVGRMAFRPK